MERSSSGDELYLKKSSSEDEVVDCLRCRGLGQRMRWLAASDAEEAGGWRMFCRDGCRRGRIRWMKIVTPQTMNIQ